MNHFIVAGIGEILWDVMGDSEELGGAPVNFCYHAQNLGAKAYPISAVGDDRRGKAALSTLAERHVSTAYIGVLAQAVTGYVRASLDEDGVASYEFPDDVAWDRLVLDKKTLSFAREVDAVCFGTLGQRSAPSRQAISDFIQATSPATLKILDINLRQHFYDQQTVQHSLHIADVLKLNDDELLVLKELEGMPGDETGVLKRLVEKYALRLAILTRGGRGSLLISPAGTDEHPGYPTGVVDTIGAGDSFTAAVALGLLQGASLPVINDRANRVAAFVCSRKGAMPVLPADFLFLDTPAAGKNTGRS